MNCGCIFFFSIFHLHYLFPPNLFLYRNNSCEFDPDYTIGVLNESQEELAFVVIYFLFHCFFLILNFKKSLEIDFIVYLVLLFTLILYKSFHILISPCLAFYITSRYYFIIRNVLLERKAFYDFVQISCPTPMSTLAKKIAQNNHARTNENYATLHSDVNYFSYFSLFPFLILFPLSFESDIVKKKYFLALPQ